MSHFDAEVKIFYALINQDNQCWICHETVKDIANPMDPGHPVTPAFHSRHDTCGDLVHRECAEQLQNHGGRYGLLPLDGDGDIEEIGWYARCLCGQPIRYFESAEPIVGKCLIVPHCTSLFYL